MRLFHAYDPSSITAPGTDRLNSEGSQSGTRLAEGIEKGKKNLSQV
jgi:hypothetical protein